MSVVIKSIIKETFFSFASVRVIKAILMNQENGKEFEVYWVNSPSVQTRSGLLISPYQSSFEKAWENAKQGMKVTMKEHEKGGYYFII